MRVLANGLSGQQSQAERTSIGSYVEQRFGVSYSEQGMTELLHRLGFAYKKPKAVGGKADAVA